MYCRTALIIFQSLSSSSKLSGGNDLSSLSGNFKEIGMTIAGIGLLCAGIAVVKKLAHNSENGKSTVISWLVALAVYIALWNML